MQQKWHRRRADKLSAAAPTNCQWRQQIVGGAAGAGLYSGHETLI